MALRAVRATTGSLALSWLNKKAAFNCRFFVPEIRRIP
ncbi:conserved hypothetical protein [Burkholderia mallei PRL-20]|nr:hypothetical protein BMASAVP1_A2481 [Burkholderia mallei SAVP1]ABO06225.1 hypothetical protein BMA10247_1804 [Burkholderia mallei NCTC 10247]EES45500.1 conserved hypothetical protein [Burkholderia mallei PRL-20]